MVPDDILRVIRTSEDDRSIKVKRNIEQGMKIVHDGGDDRSLRVRRLIYQEGNSVKLYKESDSSILVRRKVNVVQGYAVKTTFLDGVPLDMSYQGDIIIGSGQGGDCVEGVRTPRVEPLEISWKSASK